MGLLLQRIATLVCVVAMGSATGAHWVLLQSVAWLRMVAVYSQDRPLAQAVSETFDGDHPCDLCRLVEDGAPRTQKERPAPADTGGSPVQKLVAAIVAAPTLPARPASGRLSFTRHDERGLARRDAPQAPPPRRA